MGSAGCGVRRVDVPPTPQESVAPRLAAFVQAATIAAGSRRDADPRAAINGSPHDIPLPTHKHKPRILTQALRATVRAAQHLLSPGQALAIVVLGLAGVAAFGITPDTTLDAPQVRMFSRTLPLPSLAVDDAADDRYWREERMQRGDTIGSLLARASVVDPDALA